MALNLMRRVGDTARVQTSDGIIDVRVASIDFGRGVIHLEVDAPRECRISRVDKPQRQPRRLAYAK